jgi:O-antigen ligase
MFTDSLRTGFDIVSHSLILVALVTKLAKQNLIEKKSNGTISLVHKSLIILLGYIIINSHANCCSPENLMRTVRFSIAVLLFFLYAGENWKKIGVRLIYVYSIIGVMSALISILGIFSRDAWLKIWDILLRPNRVDFQHFEITRGRLAAINPIYLISLLPFCLINRNKTRLKFFGVLSACSMMFAILLWNYRSYTITLFINILVAIVILVISYKKLEMKGKIHNSIIKTILLASGLYALIAILFLPVNLVDRFTLRYKIDSENLESRALYNSLAVELFNAHALFGVGIGNYRTFAVPKNLAFRLPAGEYVGVKTPLLYTPEPHNIIFEYLSEIGLIGTGLFSFVLIAFAISDAMWLKIMLNIKKTNLLNNKGLPPLLLIVSSWMFFVSGVLNIPSRAAFYTYFILRGASESAKRSSA